MSVKVTVEVPEIGAVLAERARTTGMNLLVREYDAAAQDVLSKVRDTWPTLSGESRRAFSNFLRTQGLRVEAGITNSTDYWLAVTLPDGRSAADVLVRQPLAREFAVIVENAGAVLSGALDG